MQKLIGNSLLIFACLCVTLAASTASADMFKNVAGQQIAIEVRDSAGDLLTTDSVNITALISKNAAAFVASNDANPTEILTAASAGRGLYVFDLTQAETNADLIVFLATSSTPGATIPPVFIYPSEVMRGTDSAALASGLVAHDGKLDTAQIDLDTLTGADGAVLGTAQPNYAPNIVVPPSVSQFNARSILAASYALASIVTEARLSELDAANMPTDIDALTATIGVAGAGLSDLGGMSTGMKGEINAEADTALADYDGPTNAEMNARTLVAGEYFDPAVDVVARVTLVDITTTNTDMVDAAPTASENADTLLAKTPTVGGVATIQDVLKAMYAFARGKMTISGDFNSQTVIIFDDDNLTSLTQYTVTPSGRTPN